MTRSREQFKAPTENKAGRPDSALDRKDAPTYNPVWQTLALRPVGVQAKLSVSHPDWSTYSPKQKDPDSR